MKDAKVARVSRVARVARVAKVAIAAKVSKADEETVQKKARFFSLPLQFIIQSFREIFEFPREFQKIFRLGKRTTRDIEEIPKLFFRVTRLSFYDVRRNR